MSNIIFSQNKIGRFISRFDPGIWLVSLINLLLAIGFSICIPFLALYLHQNRGLPMALVGVIILISGLSSAGFELIGGELCDRLGRRPLVLFSAVSRSIVYVIMAFLVNYSAPIWSIALAYIASQAIGSIGKPATQAMITDLAPPQRLTESFGILRIGINVGWAAGPAIGGYLAAFMSYGWLFGVAAAISILTVFVAIFLKESITQKNQKTDFRGLLNVTRNLRFMLFIFFNLLLFTAMGQMMSTLSIYIVDRVGYTTAQYGLLLTVNGLMVIILQYPIARYIDRLSRSRIIILGCVLYAFGYLLYGWVGPYALAVIAMIIVTFGEITFAPAAMSVVAEIAPRGQKGRYMGFFGLNQVVGISIAPLFGGILLDMFLTNHLAIWASIAVMGFLGAAAFFWWARHYKVY
ncbi:MAG: MFS transporter [Dehalococcoidales bacterium]